MPARAATPIDLAGWASREDRLLFVVLLDGFDETRIDSWNSSGETLLPGMRALRAEAIVFSDVQSGAIGERAGLKNLFGDAPPEIVGGSAAELTLAVRAASSQPAARRLLLATDLFRDPRNLDDSLLTSTDPSPWANHQPSHTRSSQEDMRRRRAEMLARLYVEGRPIRRGNADHELRWIGDAMHVRADRLLGPLWEALGEASVSERSLVVITARAGAADPRRGAPAAADELRPDLVQVPFWLLTPGRGPMQLVDAPHSNGPLLRSLWSLETATAAWSTPEKITSRWSFHAVGDSRPARAAIYWNHSDFSLLLRSDGAHALYDSRNDHGNWENLAAQQNDALLLLEQRAAHELLGERLHVTIHNASAVELVVQPATAIQDLQGEGWRREGPLLRLAGQGAWEFDVDTTEEFRVRSAEAEMTWHVGEGHVLKQRQIHIGLLRAELQYGLDWTDNEFDGEAGVQILLRAGEDGILHRP
jgi:hypothetical protein